MKKSDVGVGDKFHRWTVVAAPTVGSKMCLVVCDCGTTKEVVFNYLVAGRSKSCGCLRLELHIAKYKGFKKRPEYAIWCAMKSRCTNPNSTSFVRYGGRGIKVCQRWMKGAGGMTGFECFLADMGERPSGRHSIERVDNEGNYSPSNCVWATKFVQDRNNRRNRWVVFDGRKMILADAIRLSGLSPKLVDNRIRRGWKLKDALSVPVDEYDATRFTLVEYRGQSMNLKAAAHLAGVKYHTAYRRIKAGWPIAKALTP